MSLAYLLSILLLYFCFYTLQIPFSFYNLLLFISYHYFSDYVNFYHTFHISLRSLELILYYHIIYCHRFYIYFLVLSYTIVFIYLSYTILYCHILCICVFTLTIELAFTTDSRGNLVLFVIHYQCDFAFNSMIHFDYRIDIHDRFERESHPVCHSVAM